MGDVPEELAHDAELPEGEKPEDEAAALASSDEALPPRTMRLAADAAAETETTPVVDAEAATEALHRRLPSDAPAMRPGSRCPAAEAPPARSCRDTGAQLARACPSARFCRRDA